MNIEMVIDALVQQGILRAEEAALQEMSGGTVGHVYLLKNSSRELVVKISPPEILEPEVKFLYFYRESPYVPHPVYVDPSFRYLVYEPLPGTSSVPVSMKKSELLSTLLTAFVSQYAGVPKERGWGATDEPSASWQDFLLEEIEEAQRVIGTHLEESDASFVRNLVLQTSEKKEPHLLHGDFGVHNFLFHEGKLSGILDPAPVLGDPVYDVVYAFCSSPEELHLQTLEEIESELFEQTGWNLPDIFGQVVIGLYLRLAICLKHHPDDFPTYLEAWRYWKDIVEGPSFRS
ncbi:phosphotransferase family protein [Alkalicoccus chagannorensis]|uniref:phosphotransferase family protein n=1 Tax=Alkalicoccus chagannorensis TaxID=427072 RepID=UPI00040344FA|nr:aminoglycoside phosphotransferase family protein [Alkalicoccus chagannorensis]